MYAVVSVLCCCGMSGVGTVDCRVDASLSSGSCDDDTLIVCSISSKQGIRTERQRDEKGGGLYGGIMVTGGGRPDAMMVVAYAYRAWQMSGATLGGI